ncbi:MAG: hypothetical protein AAGD07_22265 [Planctomycetota bacterium]
MLDLNNASKLESFRQFILMSEGESIAARFVEEVERLKAAGETNIDERKLLANVLEEMEPGVAEAWQEAGQLSVFASLTSGSEAKKQAR